jgi:hypothetical protein
MKKLIFLLMFSVLLFSFASAITTDMKAAYEPKETMIVKVSGNILEQINAEQVQIKRINVNIPVDYGVKKFVDDYYIWAIAPENENNYTLIIKGVSTTFSGMPVKIDYYQNFSVSGNVTEYYINPGLVYTNKDFQIKLNLNRDNSETIPVDFPSSGNILIKPGENLLNFPINGMDSGFRTMTIGKYVLPLFIIANKTANPIVNPVDNGYLTIMPSRIDSTVLMGQKPRYSFYVMNNFEHDAPINFYYDRNAVSLEPENVTTIPGNSSIYFNVSFTNYITNATDEYIYLNYSNYSLPVYIHINATSNASAVGTSGSGSGNTLNMPSKCSEVEGSFGKICSATEKCSGSVIKALEGDCCVGTCNAISDNSTTSYSWIGWVIGIAVIGVAIYLFIRYRKTKADKNIFEKNVAKAEKEIRRP